MSKQSPHPPRWIMNLLRTFCPPQLVEEIEGDLIERYNQHNHLFGMRKANRKLLWSVLLFFRPGIVFRNKFTGGLSGIPMLSNYFRISLRVMSRNKAFTAINVSGLVLAMTGALCLFLWLKHEFSFDKFHGDKERLFIAWNRATQNGEIHCWSTTPRVLAPTLEKEFATVEHAVSYANWGSTHLFSVGDTRLIRTTGVFTEPAFLNMLAFPLTKGDAATALNEPHSIVLTESFARQLFGDREAFGEPLTITDSGYSFEFIVSGVLKDLPPNTAFSFDYLISFGFLESLGQVDDYWGNNSVTNIVKLKPGVDYHFVNDQIRDISKKNYAEGQHIEMFLYPLTQMRLYSRFENGVVAGGRIEVMRLLAILGIFLLMIGCINFVNLCTARAQRRSKEVAIRKVSGAFRASLITQFLCESMIIALAAGFISLAVCYFVLPAFSTLVAEPIPMALNTTGFWAIFFMIVLGTGLLAGSYPALYMSSFRPIRILKGLQISFAGRNPLRSALVVFQFGFALTLIVSALVVNRQINFVQNRDAGYSRDHLIHLPLSGDLATNFESFSHELKERGVMRSISKTSAPLTERWSGSTEMKWRGKDPLEKTVVERIYVDQHISRTAGLTIVRGRDLDLEQFPSDSSAALINETALALMGFDDPVGEIIHDAGRDWHIVGVVKDFVFTSPFKKTEAIVMFGPKMKWLNVVYLKLNDGHAIHANLAALRELSKKYNPEYPFEFQFADVEYQRKFDNVNATLQLTTLFTSVAIFIACLGLFGLAIYMTEARMKEIGIRKVLGGSVANIAKLLSFASIRPILISVILFTPLSWYAMKWWLESFAYRTTLDAWIFVAAALTIVLIALFSIGAQIIRAAMINPVITLRNE